MRTTHHVHEPHNAHFASRLNWLRAGVLGANDGIVSTAGLVIGVASATSSRSAVLTAGIAGLLAGALSMAAGEYVSVSSQRDSEEALIAKERKELKDNPEGELHELGELYEKKGLSKEIAHEVAKQLTKIDPVRAHLEVELGINEHNLASPMNAALSSAIAFTAGALIPLLSITITPVRLRIQLTFVSVIAALFLTGYLSAKLGNASKQRAIIRVVIGGVMAMAVTYGVGKLFHVNT